MKRSTRPKMLAYERPWIWRQQAALVGAEEWQPVDERQAVGQELLREVEFADARITSRSMSHRIRLETATQLGVTCGFDVRFQDGLLNRHGCPTPGLGCSSRGIDGAVGVVSVRCPGVEPVGGEGVANVLRVHDGESFPIVGLSGCGGPSKATP